MKEQTTFETIKSGFFFGAAGAVGSIAVWSLLILIFSSTSTPVSANRAINGKTANLPCERV